MTEPKLLGGSEPAFVWDHFECAGSDRNFQVDSQLALGSAHHVERSERLRRVHDRRVIRRVYRDMTDGDAARSLLECEVPEIGDDQCKLLLVIRSLPRFPLVLYQQNSEIARIFPRQRTDGRTELVIRNVQPTALDWVSLPVTQQALKTSHRSRIRAGETRSLKLRSAHVGFPNDKSARRASRLQLKECEFWRFSPRPS